MDPLARFHPPVAAWFRAALGEPTPVQRRGWEAIASGTSALLMAPTGAGKTLAAFLVALDRLVFEPEPPPTERLRLIYVSPLKALGADVERNLRAPLDGILAEAARAGVAARRPGVAVRTGDTPQAERARFRRAPDDVLITTPESLYLLLTSAARDRLASVETVIVDEIHAVAGTKRGAHLFLSLERLEDLRGGRPPLRRIGLSATVRPAEAAARLLAGGATDGPDGPWRRRPCEIVDATEPKRLDLSVETPADDPKFAAPEIAGLKPALQPRLVELIRAHRSTLLFVNSRRLAERLAAAINAAAGEEIALAHHGSLARAARTAAEERLKSGNLPALVATSTLELGVDMGAIDLVVQIEAPPSVAAGLQRVGRAGHVAGATSKGVFFPRFKGDVLLSAAAVAGMKEGSVEETRPPRCPLDVLLQQIVAEVVAGPRTADALFATVRRAASYAELPRAAFDGALDLLSGRHASEDFAELKPRIVWDRTVGEIRAREGAHRLAVVNGGVIPDRGQYGVFLADAADGRPVRVGELDEEMVFETKTGDVLLLGASSWRVAEITHDRVLVRPAPGEPGRIPFWKADRAGRPVAFGRRTGRLAREIAEEPDADAAERRLREENGLTADAARSLVGYVRDQARATGAVPSDRTVVVERFLDELGDWRVVVLSPFGGRVHAPWCAAVTSRLKARVAPSTESLWTDDGMAYRLPATDAPPDVSEFLLDPEEAEALVVRTLHETPLFAARFRENAARALLLPRKAPGTRTPLWMQRKRAGDLMAAAVRKPDFPVTLETFRECLQDEFDLPALRELLRDLRSGAVAVVVADTERASPFAATVLFTWTGSFLYDGDASMAERRAQALTIDHRLLGELLGDAEARELLEPEVVAAAERRLQLLDPPLARDDDRIHDLLRRLGPLAAAEIAERAEAPDAAAAASARLVAAGRAFEAEIGGASRIIAAEDAARVRDALGVPPPRSLPAAFLAPVEDPLGDLLRRFARTHGPFAAESPARRFGLGAAPVVEALDRLVAAGRLVEGAFLKGGRDREWCDTDVLATLRRRTLARLRAAVEPVDGAAFARFLLDRHGVERPRSGPDALAEAFERLHGVALPASVWFEDVLPARVAGFRPWDVDRLCLEGSLAWRGVEALGPHDGRVVFRCVDDAPDDAPRGAPVAGEVAARIREALARRGALLFHDLAAAARSFPAEVLETLWEMVFAGEVANDATTPLLARLFGGKARRGRAYAETHRLLRKRPVPPGGEGRWSLVAPASETTSSPTERATAAARALLRRYGVVSRDAARADGVAGGFAAVYPVLRAMEERGTVRRGYFVAGLGPAQFAEPGAAERLRALRDPPREASTCVLAATDPANPYGAALPWPAGEPRPQRAAGASVVLRDGVLLAWLGREGRAATTFLPQDEGARAEAADAVAEALARSVDGVRRRALVVERVDGVDAAASPLAAALGRAGFVATSKGLLLRAAAAARGRAPPEERR